MFEVEILVDDVDRQLLWLGKQTHNAILVECRYDEALLIEIFFCDDVLVIIGNCMALGGDKVFHLTVFEEYDQKSVPTVKL